MDNIDELVYNQGNYTFNGERINNFRVFLCGFGTWNNPMKLRIYSKELPVEQQGVEVNVSSVMLRNLREGGHIGKY